MGWGWGWAGGLVIHHFLGQESLLNSPAYFLPSL